MIVVDASAIVAILFGEPFAAALVKRLEAETERIMSVVGYVEAGTVLAGRRSSDKLLAIADLDRFLEEAGIVLAPIDADQARQALYARIRFGRGMGQGGALNFGDSFAYALARTNNAPLLFVGDDFRSTDIVAAVDAAAR
jgi:ribonuclease VapC